MSERGGQSRGDGRRERRSGRGPDWGARPLLTYRAASSAVLQAGRVLASRIRATTIRVADDDAERVGEDVQLQCRRRRAAVHVMEELRESVPRNAAPAAPAAAAQAASESRRACVPFLCGGGWRITACGACNRRPGGGRSTRPLALRVCCIRHRRHRQGCSGPEGGRDRTASARRRSPVAASKPASPLPRWLLLRQWSFREWKTRASGHP